MRRWLLWIPVLMVAALVYWTVALGLGGLSLMAVSGFSIGEEGIGLPVTAAATDSDTAEMIPPQDGYEPILVHIEESVEPEDVDDNAGCGFTDELSADAREASDRIDPAAQPAARQGLFVEP